MVSCDVISAQEAMFDICGGVVRVPSISTTVIVEKIIPQLLLLQEATSVYASRLTSEESWPAVTNANTSTFAFSLWTVYASLVSSTVKCRIIDCFCGKHLKEVGCFVF